MNNTVLAIFLGVTTVSAACSDPKDYKLPNGMCTPCPATTQPDANQVTCVPKYFCHLAQGQINTATGCKTCDACSEPNTSNSACVPKANQSAPACIALKATQAPKSKCLTNQFLSSNGICTACPACHLQDNTGFGCTQIPHPSYQQCMNTVCDWKTEILDALTGKCQKCTKCYVPNSVKNLCEQDKNYATCMNPAATKNPTVCKWLTEILNPLGICEPCGKCTAPDWQNKYCLPVTDYTTCMAPTTCPTGQIKAPVTGVCQVCPSGWVANPTATSCDKAPVTTWAAPPTMWTPAPAPAPTVTYVQAPAPVYTPAPAPVYTPAPAPVTITQAPAPVYTSAPEPYYTSAPAPVYTSAPEPYYTSAPAPVYTSAPSYPTYSQPSYPTYSQPSYTSSYPTSYSSALPSYNSGYASTSSVGNYWLFAEQEANSEESEEDTAEESP